MHTSLLARCILAAEGARLGRCGLEFWHQTQDLFGAITGSNVADVNEVVAAIYAGHQRTELVAVAVPSADDHLVTRSALGLGPGIGSPRSVAGCGLLRNHAFQRHPAGGLQHSVAATLEMLDVANFGRVLPVYLLDQSLQGLLAVNKALLSQVFAPKKQQIEGEEDQVIGLAVGQGSLQTSEIGRAPMVQRNDFSVDDAIRQGSGGLCYCAELGSPIQALARLQRDVTVLYPHLNAVAVEFDLVDPVVSGRRTLHRNTQLRRNERRHSPIGLHFLLLGCLFAG